MQNKMLSRVTRFSKNSQEYKENLEEDSLEPYPIDASDTSEGFDFYATRFYPSKAQNIDHVLRLLNE